MLPQKKARELFKKFAIDAARRYAERKDVRKQTGTVKGSTEEEAGKSNKRLENYYLRESKRPVTNPDLLKPIKFPERIIKGNDLKEFPPNEIALRAGKPVARIETIPANGNLAEGIATGFLVSPNLLMTNYHVFPGAADAKDCAANFFYERNITGINSGCQFVISADKFFISDEGLDFALVYIEPVSIDNKFALTNIGFLNLYHTKGKITNGQPISIIQYPGGGVKNYAYQNNTVVDILEDQGFIQYTTDTKQGSSGSPAYNSAWEVAALHHSGVPLVIKGKIIDTSGMPWDEENQTEEEIQWVANEGISISRIIEKLKTFSFQDAEKQKILNTFFETTKDPLLENVPSNANGSTGILKPAIPTILQPEKFTTMGDIIFNISGTTNIIINPGTKQDVDTGRILNGATTNGAVANFIKEKKQNFDADYDGRQGYDPNFLNEVTIALPEVIPSRENEMFLSFSDNKPYVLNYHHYSLIMSKKRRLAMWTASNIDYNEDKKSTKARADFGTEEWRLDPRIPEKYQITDPDFYKPATKVDRGHIVRREDNCWGDTEPGIEYANADTYHWTNCTPQHELFNRATFGAKGLWGMLEDQVQSQVKFVNGRAILFAGPILDNDNDPVAEFDNGKVQYPLKFWKILVAFTEEEGLTAYGFILDQSNVVNKFGLEALDFSMFKKQMATVRKISELTGVIFDPQIVDADVLKDSPFFESGLKPLRNAGEIITKKQKKGVLMTGLEKSYK